MTIPSPVSRVVLGTVQIGLNYGISNQSGLMRLDEATSLISTAYTRGCRTLDTAEAYGNSEQRLGEIGVDRFEVISKLTHLPADCDNLERHVYTSVKAMLSRVNVRMFEGVLLHNPQELLALTSKQVKQTRAGFKRLKEEGLIRTCGVSVYTPLELIEVSKRFESDLVQLPSCPLDLRWFNSGLVQKLRAQGVEIHVRSVFLQGLLLMNLEEVPAYFSPWRNLLRQWHEWTCDLNLSPLQASLQITLHNPMFDKLVLGAQSRSELDQQLDIITTPISDIPSPDFGTIDEAFLNPSLWKK